MTSTTSQWIYSAFDDDESVSSAADPVKGLSELARVAQPDGHILLLEHVRPRIPVLGWIADLLTPIIRRTLEPNINRRTERNIADAGLQIEAINRWEAWREVSAKPGAATAETLLAS